MLIEQPPKLYRWLYPQTIWRIPAEKEKTVYLTFDDGPIPQVTPWVLDLLDGYNIKATFFCVGDNVQKHPEVYAEILKRGHTVGNHTFNHLQGMKTLTRTFVKNAELARKYIESDLFRPPHGHMRWPQYWFLKKKYKIVMWDVVTRDYSKLLTSEEVCNNVKKYTRNGSIIVFHDSLKAERNMKEALPRSIDWLIQEGYSFKSL